MQKNLKLFITFKPDEKDNRISGKQKNDVLKPTQEKEEEFSKLEDRSKEITQNISLEVKNMEEKLKHKENEKL